jgi:hypothetical protein
MKKSAIPFFVVGTIVGIVVGYQWRARTDVESIDPLEKPFTASPVKDRRTLPSETSWLVEKLQEHQKGSETGVANLPLINELRTVLLDRVDSRRLKRWLGLLEAVRPEDAAMVDALLREEGRLGRGHGNEERAFWQHWGEIAPKEALAFLLADATVREGPLLHMAKAWALRDAPAAVQRVSEMEDNAVGNKALEAVLHGFAETNLEGATTFATTRLDPSKYRQAAVHITGSALNALGMERAKSWFDALPQNTPSDFRSEVARCIIYALERQSADAVLQFAKARIDQPWMESTKEVTTIASLVARKGSDPWDFIAWNSAQGREVAVQQSIGEVFRVSPSSINSAESWLAANPASPAFDRIASGLVIASTKAGDSERAQKWVEQIKDPQIQKDTKATLTYDPLRR